MWRYFILICSKEKVEGTTTVPINNYENDIEMLHFRDNASGLPRCVEGGVLFLFVALALVPFLTRAKSLSFLWLWLRLWFDYSRNIVASGIGIGSGSTPC